MDLEAFAGDRSPVKKLLGDVRITDHGQQSWKHVDVRADTGQDRACLDLARPPGETRHAPPAFPVGVLVAPEGSVASVRPGVVLWSVVSGIHDEGVVGDAQFFKFVEDLTNLLVMSGHPIAVVVLSCLSSVLVGKVCPEVHGRRVVPKEKWLLC